MELGLAAMPLEKNLHRTNFLGKWMPGWNAPTPKDDPVELDISDIEFEGEDFGWGGMTRPGARSSISDEEFKPEEAMGDEWDSDREDNTDDDDDHGG